MMAQKQGKPFRYQLSFAVTAGSHGFTLEGDEEFLRSTNIVPNRIGTLSVERLEHRRLNRR